MTDELPFKVVRSHDHDHDEVLARAVNLLIARHAYREAARISRDRAEQMKSARPRQDRALGGYNGLALREAKRARSSEHHYKSFLRQGLPQCGRKERRPAAVL
jgi:hypothetical protein